MGNKASYEPGLKPLFDKGVDDNEEYRKNCPGCGKMIISGVADCVQVLMNAIYEMRYDKETIDSVFNKPCRQIFTGPYVDDIRYVNIEKYISFNTCPACVHYIGEMRVLTGKLLEYWLKRKERAATKVQRAWKKHQDKRNKAASVIQAAWDTYWYKPNEEGVSRAALAGWNRLQKELQEVN